MGRSKDWAWGATGELGSVKRVAVGSCAGKTYEEAVSVEMGHGENPSDRIGGSPAEDTGGGGNAIGDTVRCWGDKGRDWGGSNVL